VPRLAWLTFRQLRVDRHLGHLRVDRLHVGWQERRRDQQATYPPTGLVSNGRHQRN